MKASIAWLSQYVDINDLPPTEVAEHLTMSGLEVDELYDRYEYLNKVVTAKLVKVSAHPNSDRLKVCLVDAGSYGQFQIVCGAANAREGLVSPLALIGAQLPSGMVIKKSELRGVSSEGMLCSASELGLPGDSTGIMELDSAIGVTLKDFYKLSEWVVDIEVTPNRPDALSIIGIARDLAALLNRPLKMPTFNLHEEGPEVTSLASVNIEAPDHAYRYVSRVIQGIKVGPSPLWLVERLNAVGVRSVNNVVDITNYVMMEIGLPLHGFDLDKLSQSSIIVKLVKSGETFETLDGQTRTLRASHNLMICDAEKPVGLAGIMGGANSQITEKTVNVLLEGACFNSTTIRRTARAMGHSTEASYRYERGCDMEICAFAVDRAAALLQEICGGRLAKGRLDCYPRPYKAISVPFSPEKCNKMLGTSYKTEDMIRVLNAIGVKTSGNKELIATFPSWRPDLQREADIWEEVVRLLDFDALPSTLPKAIQIASNPPANWVFNSNISSYLVSLGYTENITYSFYNPDFADKLSLPAKSEERLRVLPILNPLTEDQSVLRTTLIPNLINVLKKNQYHGIFQVPIFELGAVFWKRGIDEQPEEKQRLAGLLSGKTFNENWAAPKIKNADFWDLKGHLEAMAKYLGLELEFYRDDDLPLYYDAAEAAMIKLAGTKTTIGHCGRLSQSTLKNFSLKNLDCPVYVFELDLPPMAQAAVALKRFKEIAKFPKVERDMALVLDKNVTASDILKAVKSNKHLPLVDISIFDVYEGEPLAADKKSLALRLIFQDYNATLTDEQVNGFFNEIFNQLVSQFKADLRS